MNLSSVGDPIQYVADNSTFLARGVRLGAKWAPWLDHSIRGRRSMDSISCWSGCLPMYVGGHNEKPQPSTDCFPQWRFLLLPISQAQGWPVRNRKLPPVSDGVVLKDDTALTYWYEIYYDVLLEGRYFTRIAQMHEKYGPIVRINPHEVHFNDPKFIHHLFPGPSRKTDKYVFTGRRTGSKSNITNLHVPYRQRLIDVVNNSQLTVIKPC